MKQTAISLVIASALLAATPALAQQVAPNQAAQTRQAGSPSQLVLGVHGRGASDADVKLFADALADNLMQRYGSSLLDFNTRLQVRVKSETPLRGGSMVKVSSEFLREGGEPIPVDYLMRKTGSEWKVFDVMVEGVSFVQTFRNQFDGPLSRQSIPEVAAQLEAGKLQAGTN